MKDVLKILGALVLIVAAVYLFTGGSTDGGRTGDFPDGVWWICADCKHEFDMDRDRVVELYHADPDSSVPCPECGKRKTLRARKCPLEACSEVYPDTKGFVSIDGKACCPICKQPLP